MFCCKDCEKIVVEYYGLKSHLLCFHEKFFNSQNCLVGGFLVADVCDFLALVVLGKSDADSTILIRVELGDCSSSLQLPDFEEKFAPLLGEHEVEENVSNSTLAGLDCRS